MDTYPKLILLFSGKRKSGKDYVTDTLQERLSKTNVIVLKISGPIKSYWAKNKGLSLKELLSAGPLKEQYRKEMISWSEAMRATDHGIFCREAIDMYNARSKPIWIVSDIRRKTDISWFKAQFPQQVKTIRINATDETRKIRGWNFTNGIDDASTECDLDSVTDWDYIVNNNHDNSNEMESFISDIQNIVTSVINS